MFSEKLNRFSDCLSCSTLSKDQSHKEKCHVSQTICSIMHSQMLAGYRWKVSCWCVTCVVLIRVGQLMETEVKGWAPIGVVAAIVPWNLPLVLLS